MAVGFSFRAQYSPEEQSLDIYLKEISRIPLLSPEDEVTLAAEIQKGDSEALQRLVNGNLRFVVSVAKQYAKQRISLADLINEGNIGLIRAAEKFDPSKGCKFISYAVWWVRQAILTAIAEQSRVVRLPLNQVGALNKISRARSRLGHELGRSPTSSELAVELQLTTKEIENTLKLSANHLSLDAPCAGDEDNTLKSQLMENAQNSPDNKYLEKALTSEIEDILCRLSEREARIISLYFGLQTNIPKTLEEIGKEFNLTRERIRQIKDRALEKIKRTSRAKHLQLYL